MTMYAFLVAAVSARVVRLDVESHESTKALEHLFAKAMALGVECEEMCKATGAYPTGCACPGWNGMPASSNDQDSRNCYAKYCVPIAHTPDPCPSDAFVTCVTQNSKVPALLQVDWTNQIHSSESAIGYMKSKLERDAADCVALGVECEEMCKQLGAFPHGCKCPGWNGAPGSSDEQDGRDCYTRFCVPIAHTDDPCPSDEFVTCVAEHTKHSLVQVDWAALKEATTTATRNMKAQH